MSIPDTLGSTISVKNETESDKATVIVSGLAHSDVSKGGLWKLKGELFSYFERKPEDFTVKASNLPKDVSLKEVYNNTFISIKNSMKNILSFYLSDSAYIRIRNVSKLSSENLLLNYLSSERRSNGGEIKRFICKSHFDFAIVEFEDVATATRVLSKAHIILDGHIIYTSKLPPKCKSSVYLRNIPQWVTMDELTIYLKGRVCVDVKSVNFNDNDDGAIVTFLEDIDSDAMANSFLQRPLKTGLNQIQPGEIEIFPVAYPDAVLLFCNDPSQDSVEIALEGYLSRINPNEKYTVRYSIYKPEKETWLVCFDSYEAVRLFPHNCEITINKKNYQLAPYFDCLGWQTKDNKGTPNFLRIFGPATVNQNLCESEALFLIGTLGRSYVEQELKNNSWNGCFIMKENINLNVTAENIEKSRDMLRFILNSIKTFSMKLDEDMKIAWISENAEKFLSRNNTTTNIDNYFAWALNDDTLNLTFAAEKEEPVKNMVKRFFDDNTVYQEIVLNAGIEGLYLKKFHQTAFMQKIPDAIKFHQNGAIQMKGTKCQIEMLQADIKTVLTGTDLSEYIVSGPGMANFFKNQTGFTDITAITDRTRTLIISEDELLVETSKVEPIPARPTVLDKTKTEKRKQIEGLLHGRIKVIVRQDDITAEEVDAIVNAANENLLHGAGLAEAIVVKGGQEIQNECNKYIRKNGQLKVGGTFVSSGGKLCCEKIIHACGPRYQDGRNNEEEDLKNTIKNIIQTADNQKFSSIAIPAVSTKIFGYPIDQAIPIIVNTTALETTNLNMVKEIRFIDTNATCVNKFIEELKKCRKFKQTTSFILPFATIKNKPPIESRNRVLPTVREKETNTTVEHLAPIELVKDNIVNVANRCDVIVNTTGRNANDMIASGKVCEAIAQAAGQIYTDDVRQHYPNGLGNLPIAITGAGKLECKKVFHISCSHWDSQSSLDELEAKMTICLDEAEKHRFNSIAFPAIGTGALKYPASLVANTMFNNVNKWFKLHSNCSLRRIMFVVFPSDTSTVRAFDQEFANKILTQPTRESRQFPSNSKVESQQTQKIILVKDDIVNVAKSCDIIVNSTCIGPNDMVGAGKACKAISEAAGQAYIDDIIKRYPNGLGNLPLAITIAGNLGCKQVYHISCLQWDPQSIQSKLRELDTKIAACLDEAEKQKMSSIAFPAIGTGILQYPASLVASTMYKTSTAWFSTHPNSHLKKVIMVVFPSDTITVSAFEQEFSAFKRFIGSFWPFGEKDAQSNVPILNHLHDKVPEQKLKFHIFGQKSGVDQALANLDKLCREKCPEKAIIRPIIKELDEDAIELLRIRAERNFNVYFQVNKDEAKIKIKGNKAEDCRELLVELLDNLTQEYDRQNPKKVEWFRRQNNAQNWQLVNDSKLENEYKRMNGKGSVVCMLEGISNVNLDFDKMTILAGTILFQLKRREVNDSVPIEWDYNGKLSHNGVELIQLDPISKEYKEIAAAVANTSPPGTGIVMIERVENPLRYRQYQLLKQSMIHSMPPNMEVEKKLFHGNNNTNHILSICRTGFDRGLAGIAVGTKYGFGSYFARDFQYSMKYSKQSKTIFYAFVLTGQYTLGNPNMKTAPVLDRIKATKYDSVVDNVANPAIFVVFTDNNAYPAYVITYS